MTTSTTGGYAHIFLPNKYTRWYYSIVNKANSEERSKGCSYFEIHHIVPKCIGGSNTRDNLVLLTAKEHYICHLLLIRMTTNQAMYKMVHAFLCMRNLQGPNHQRKTIVTSSILYQRAKQQHATFTSERMKQQFTDVVYKDKHRQRVSDSWRNGTRAAQLERMKLNSPLKKKVVHDKSMRTREERKSNVFITNNPMHCQENIEKKVSKTRGDLHYLRRTRKYYYRHLGGSWMLLDTSNGLETACAKHGWPYSTFFNVLNGKLPKTGPLKEIEIRREYLHEDQNC